MESCRCVAERVLEHRFKKKHAHESKRVWEGTHHASEKKLAVGPRADRPPQGLASLWEQGSQILQVFVRDFGGDQKAALEFVQRIGEEYSIGTLKKEQLKPTAKARMAEAGHGRKAPKAKATTKKQAKGGRRRLQAPGRCAYVRP